MSGGRAARLHPQLLSSPSLHERLRACTTPAADMACVKAASRLAVTKYKGIIDRYTTIYRLK